MPELVLVTGGSGYIAGWCIAELLHRGYDVRTTVRSPERERFVTEAVSTEVDPAGRLGFAVADLTADDGWDAAMKGVDYVLHVAPRWAPPPTTPRPASPRRATARCACCGRRPRRAYGVW